MSSYAALDPGKGSPLRVIPHQRAPEKSEPGAIRQQHREVHSPAEQLHEVRGSLAGVANAIRLLVRHDASLTEARQHQLEALLESEVTRLERLVFEETPRSRGVLAVADVLGPVIGARRLAGQKVHWTPSRRTVIGVGDFIAEIVNILLVNAAQHATGSPVYVDAFTEAETVVIKVSDRGPGIPEAIVDRIFDAGSRGDGGGSGLGLPLARRLAIAQAGDLRLLPSSSGATFVLVLPTAAAGWA